VLCFSQNDGEAIDPEKRDKAMRPYLMRTEQIILPRRDNAITNFFKQGRSQELYPAMTAIAGVVCMGLYNSRRNHPLSSRLYLYVASGIAGYWLGGMVDHYETKRFAERDAMLHHYISLHPEDFVEEPSPKLKYVLYPWHPVREHWDGLKGYPYR
jgi:hypothetical protein